MEIESDSGNLNNFNFTDLASKRSSVRAYSDSPVAEEVLEECLEASRLAPSACNAQPWFFHVIKSKDIKDEIASAMTSGVYMKMNSFVKDAPVIVAAETLKREKAAPCLAGMIRGVRYEMMDVCIALEHFALKAAEVGLGTCWIGWFNEKAVKKALGLPRSSSIDVMMTVGYPKNLRALPKKRKTLDQIRKYI